MDPVEENVMGNAAVALAEETVFRSKATPATETVPSGDPPAEKVTVPVGAAPLLLVAMAAVRVTCWFMAAVDGPES